MLMAHNFLNQAGSPNVSKREVFDLLCPYGQPEGIDIRSTDSSAIVWFATAEEASAVIEGLHRTTVGGYKIGE